MKRKTISVILIFVMLLSLTACIPQRYSQDEYNDLESKGRAAVEKWLKDNEPDAVLKDLNVSRGTNTGNFGISDDIHGTYELNGKEVDFVYVLSDSKMYVDTFYEIASVSVADMYAKGLGFDEYATMSDSYGRIGFAIPCTEYFEDSNNPKGRTLADMNSEGIEQYYDCLPYELTEAEIPDFLEEATKEYHRFSSNELAYYIDTKTLHQSSFNLKYLQEHPFINSFVFHYDNVDYYFDIDIDTVEQDDYKGLTCDKVISVSKVNKNNSSGSSTYYYDFDTLFRVTHK